MRPLQEETHSGEERVMTELGYSHRHAEVKIFELFWQNYNKLRSLLHREAYHGK